MKSPSESVTGDRSRDGLPRVAIFDVETVPCEEAAKHFLTEPPEFNPIAILAKVDKRNALNALAEELGFSPKPFKNMDDLRQEIGRQLNDCAPDAMPSGITAAYASTLQSWGDSYYDKAALQTMTAQVVTIACAEYQGGLLEDTVWAMTTDDEVALLTRISLILGRERKDPERVSAICGFNIINFDGPMLRNRMLIRGVEIPDLLSQFPRYRSWPQIDMREELGNWDRFSKGTLHDWCWRLGVSAEGDSTDPNDIRRWFEAGEYAKLSSHCKDHLLETVELYERLVHTLLGRRLPKSY